MTDECVSRAAAILLSELADDLEAFEPPEPASAESKASSLPVIFHVFGNASARVYHAAVLLMHSSAHSQSPAHALPSSICSPNSESVPADTDRSSASSQTQNPSPGASRNRVENKSLAGETGTRRESGSRFGSISVCVRGAVFDSCPARGGIRQESQEYAARFPVRSGSVQTLVRCLFVLVYLCNLVATRVARVCKRALGFATGADLLFGRRLDQTPSPKPKAALSAANAADTTPSAASSDSAAYRCDIFAECGAHCDTWRFFLENDLPAAESSAAACECGEWPHLFLYSKADRLTPATDVRRVVLSRQRRAIDHSKAATRTVPSRLNGLEGYVAATCWENSGHLQHLSRNETGYVKTIADFLEYIAPIAPAASDVAAEMGGGEAANESPTRSPRVRATARHAVFRQGSSSDHEADDRPRSPAAATVALRDDTAGTDAGESSLGETPVNSSEC